MIGDAERMQREGERSSAFRQGELDDAAPDA